MKLHVKPKIPCRQEQFRKANEKIIENIGKTKSIRLTIKYQLFSWKRIWWSLKSLSD